MAEVIQFNCPACGTLLRLPLALASERGPCPSCDKEIMAPDPHKGIGAFEIPARPPAMEIEPFQSFVESPLESAPVVAEPESPPEVAGNTVSAKPQWAVLLLSCLLTGVVAMALGFALGVGASKFFEAEPPPPMPVVPVVTTEVKAPGTDPVPLRVKPIIDETPVLKTPEPTRVSAAAEAALRAFLDAPDWANRSAYVLFPKNVRAAMEAYSHKVPDGPTHYTSISVKQSRIDETSGHTLLVFFVSTEDFPSGIPVAVQETSSGWLVDWQTFIEFRDQLFQQFVDGPADTTGRFHLIVSPPPPERAASTENEHFVSFLINAPLNKSPQLAFLKKSSEALKTFHTATAEGGIFTPVLEMAKRETADGQSYLEIISVAATDWLPREN